MSDDSSAPNSPVGQAGAYHFRGSSDNDSDDPHGANFADVEYASGSDDAGPGRAPQASRKRVAPASTSNDEGADSDAQAVPVSRNKKRKRVIDSDDDDAKPGQNNLNSISTTSTLSIDNLNNTTSSIVGYINSFTVFSSLKIMDLNVS